MHTSTVRPKRLTIGYGLETDGEGNLVKTTDRASRIVGPIRYTGNGKRAMLRRYRTGR